MPRILVTGGAGFLGSHLCERLLAEGWEVVCVDNFLTGSPDNVAHLAGTSGFVLEQHDVTDHLHVDGALDAVAHLASPASPADYLGYPIQTLKVGAIGTLHALGLARSKGARMLLTSTSEVYGDPKVNPQTEEYWGNVNPIGPRSVYDEAKRYAEALVMAYHRTHGVPVRIVRIFNTYGPRMRRGDGRAIPTFISQSLNGEPHTVHGSGSQTRSFCYVDDLIEGIYRLLVSDHTGPINIGNPHEVTISELAGTIDRLLGRPTELTFVERPVDDPDLRCPDIGKARDLLGWEPQVSLEDGLRRTIGWARQAWSVA